MSKEMLPEERRDKIYNLLRESKAKKVSELARKFDVSRMTIRRDLKTLEERDLIRRTHGGAVARKKFRLDYNVEKRMQENKQLKQKIGLRAAELIKDHDYLALDASTTVLQLARNFPRRQNINVVTNGLLTSRVLSEQQELKVILAGGEIRKEALSAVGSIARKTIESFNFTRTFMSANAVSSVRGVNDTDMAEIAIKKSMIANSSQVIVLADSTKLGQEAFSVTCELEEIDMLITDDKVEEKIINKFRKKEVEVLVAS